jgi:hypothetical protein
MRPHRIFTVLSAVAVTTFAAPVARADEPAAPVLWEGRIVGANGAPAAGAEVVAFARPSGGEIGATDAGLAPVARVTTDGSGHYVLRSGRTGALRAVETDSGWTNVMVAAFGPDGGFSLATDSIAWEPAGGFHATAADSNPNRGRWLTTPAQRVAAEDGNIRAASAPDPESVDRDRPAVMTLTAGPDHPIRAQSAKPPPLRQEGMCAGPTKTERLPLPDQGHFTPVGEMHLEQAWSGQFAYTTSHSTSFQVGVRHDGSGWSAGGSTSSLKESTSKTGTDRGLTENHMYTFGADLDYARYTWRCNQGDSWHMAETVEPAFWRGGIHVTDQGAPPACDPTKTSPVIALGYHSRGDDETATMASAISVAGFVGSLTTTVAHGVSFVWNNNVPRERYLCGSTAFITQDTRIASLR